MALYKVILDGKELLCKGMSFNSAEHRNNTITFPSSLPSGFVSKQVGEHSLALVVKTQQGLFKTDNFFFEVKAQKEDERALEEYKVKSLESLSTLKFYDGYLFENVSSFLKKFPKSYLSEMLGEDLRRFVFHDLKNGRFHQVNRRDDPSYMYMTQEQRKKVLSCLIQVNFAKSLNWSKQYYEWTKDSHHLQNKEVPLFWYHNLLKHVQEAPKTVELKTQNDGNVFQPGELVKLKVKYQGLKVEFIYFGLLAWAEDGKLVETPDSSGGGGGPGYKKMEFRNLSYETVGERNVTAYFYTGFDVFKVSNFKIKVKN